MADLETRRRPPTGVAPVGGSAQLRRARAKTKSRTGGGHDIAAPIDGEKLLDEVGVTARTVEHPVGQLV